MARDCVHFARINSPRGGAAALCTAPIHPFYQQCILKGPIGPHMTPDRNMSEPHAVILFEERWRFPKN